MDKPKPLIEITTNGMNSRPKVVITLFDNSKIQETPDVFFNGFRIPGAHVNVTKYTGNEVGDVSISFPANLTIQTKVLFAEDATDEH